MSAEALRETLDGGQAFRWNPVAGGAFEGVWNGCAARLRRAPPQGWEVSFPRDADPEASRAALRRYFALDTPQRALADRLPWRSDPVLAAAMARFRGLRVLRQPIGETLFAFLCSPTKRIPQIKAICERVAAEFGDPLPGGFRALPSWARLARAGETPLRAARLGYRATYIAQCARLIAEDPERLRRIEKSPTPDAREQLMELPGVGRKIADCVLLFGAGRLEAFPIDTWMARVLAEAYGLRDWKTPQWQAFARAHFGDAAGLAQQYLFAAARAGVFARA